MVAVMAAVNQEMLEAVQVVARVAAVVTVQVAAAVLQAVKVLEQRIKVLMAVKVVNQQTIKAAVVAALAA
jgi:hypothetical protein